MFDNFFCEYLVFYSRIDFVFYLLYIYIFSLSLSSETREIKWPDAEDDDVPPEAKDIVENLLCIDPFYRLGSNVAGGVAGVKEHAFFNGIDWQNLLRQKAEFVPSLEGEDDTSYFDRKMSFCFVCVFVF